jgi:hypothetical protein
MVTPTKQLDWGERLSYHSVDDLCHLQLNNGISTADEYEPLVNEDETPPSTV